ncbi:MAG TPA: SP_1767 family glycosyltransferase [Muribaculaceae bacterium]|nr:SP_1767 family glycosyltransferase [Muribaculaceae bacterium]
MKQSRINKCNYTILFAFRYIFSRRFRMLRKIKIKDSLHTIRHIIENKASVSRFGDGELKLISGKDTDFQKADPLIVDKLRTIVSSNLKGHIVCLPYPWKNLRKLKYSAFEYWGEYLNRNLDSILSVININNQYYDASFTRFYIDYKNDKLARRVVPMLKKIWNKKDICIIEGEYSRLGVGNDLFENTKSIKRIICPAKNAFHAYDDIMEAALKMPKDTIYLIALGMTATCLAYDLHIKGCWAIDIGHVDVEYEWFRMGATEKVPLPYKYVAECGDKVPHQQKTLSEYESQIISRILV